MQSNQELLKAAHEAFNAHDFEVVLAMMHPDVDWPNRIEGGRIRGRNNVREYWKRRLDHTHSHVETSRIEDDANGRTVVHVHQVVRDQAGNILMDQMVQHVYFVQDGFIERMDILTPDADLRP